MNGLKLLVAGLGLVIVAMLATVVITLAHRMSRPAAPLSAAASVILSEPPGTHLAAISTVGDRLAVLLQGGGPDRLLFLAPTGQVTARVWLAHTPGVALPPPIP